MKKITYLFLSMFFLISFSSLGQRESEFNNPKKKSFEKKSFGTNTSGEKAGPPDPGGGGGNPIPISGGFLLLSGGLLLYSLLRKQNNVKDA